MRKDWDIIRNDYIRNPITYEELSKRYNVSIKTLERHAVGKCKCCKSWVLGRDEYKERVRIKTLTAEVDNTVNDRQRLLDTIDNLVNLKIDAETRVLLRTVNIEDLKLLATLISKSKNNIPDLIKVSELLKGNATERQDITQKEKDERLNRLRERLLINNSN